MGQNRFKVKGARGRSGLVTAGSVALQALDAPETRDGGSDPSEWIENEEVVQPDVADVTTEDPPVADAQRDGRDCEDNLEDGVAGAEGDHEVDALEDEIGRTVVRQRDEAAENEPEFSPLEGTLPPATTFPLDALGPLLLPFAQALQELTGAPIGMCATALLAFVNVVVQGLADIRFIGSRKPISEYFVVIGSSGERKSSLFSWLGRPLDRFERMMEAEIRQAMEACDGEDEEEKKVDPLLPDILFSEATTPALYHVLPRCLGRLGMFVTEAGIFIGGHGMKRDNHLALLAQLSSLYDAEPVKIYRRGDGKINVRCKRFNMLLMGQWSVVRGFFSDPMNRTQGFMSRVLVCYPESLIGSRPLVMRPVESEAKMREYDQWMMDLLSRPLPLEEGSRNDLLPPALKMTADAEEHFAAFYNEIERLMGSFGPDSEKVSLINKNAQTALRLGATLQVAENPDSRELDGEHVARGVALARYFLSESLRLCSTPVVSEHVEAAKTLLDALKDKRRCEFSLSWCYSQGPHSLRTKKALKPVLDFLVDCGWLVIVALPKRPGVAKARKVYRLTTRARRELGL